MSVQRKFERDRRRATAHDVKKPAKSNSTSRAALGRAADCLQSSVRETRDERRQRLDERRRAQRKAGEDVSRYHAATWTSAAKEAERRARAEQDAMQAEQRAAVAAAVETEKVTTAQELKTPPKRFKRVAVAGAAIGALVSEALSADQHQ